MASGKIPSQIRRKAPLATAGRLNSFSALLPLALLLFAFCVTSAGPAYAGPMKQAICFIFNLVVVDIGPGLATFGIVVLGVAASMGKVTWGLAFTVIIGISIMFGAVQVAGMLGVGGGC